MKISTAGMARSSNVRFIDLIVGAPFKAIVRSTSGIWVRPEIGTGKPDILIKLDHDRCQAWYFDYGSCETIVDLTYLFDAVLNTGTT